MEPLSGVYAILATPFLPDGALDVASLRRLTGATVEAGVDALERQSRVDRPVSVLFMEPSSVSLARPTSSTTRSVSTC